MPAVWSYQVESPSAQTAAEQAASVELLAIADLRLDENFDLYLDADHAAELVTGAAAVAQCLRITLHFWLGSWFLNLLEGIPYVEKVLIKNPDLGLIESLFRKAMLLVPGVGSVVQFEMTLDGPARRLSISPFAVRLIDGSTLTFTDAPFILV